MTNQAPKSTMNADGRSYQHVQITAAGDARHYNTKEHQVTFVPLSIKRRQHRKLLIAPANHNSRHDRFFDVPLIRTLGKAFYWQKLMDSGEVKTIAELAGRLNLEPGWVAEVLRMTRLSPELVQAIVEGQQPKHFNLHAMRGRSIDVSMIWNAQCIGAEEHAPRMWGRPDMKLPASEGRRDKDARSSF